MKYQPIISGLFLWFICTQPILASEIEHHTGTLLVATETNIQIHYSYGGLESFLIVCRPADCNLIHQLELGKRVYFSLELVNRERLDFVDFAKFPPWNRFHVLIDARQCTTNDMQCDKLEAEGRERRKQIEIAAERSDEVRNECDRRMYEDLKLNKNFISENQTQEERPAIANINNKFYELQNNPDSRECAADIESSHRGAFVATCIIHGCGDELGGSCEYLSVEANKHAMMIRVMEQCAKEK